MIFDEKQLIQFINKNKKVILKHKNNSIINITSNLKKYLDKKINHDIYNIIDQNLSSEKTLLFLFFIMY